MVAAQLSTAMAVLILRSSSWQPQRLVPDLESLLASQLPAHSQRAQRAAEAQVAQHPATTVAHVAMLQVLAALPPACSERQCSVHPDRRLAVTEALASSPHVRPWVQATFAAVGPGPASQQLQQLFLTLGLRVVRAWCELGHLPVALPQHASVVQLTCHAALRRDTCASAAEALVSMLSTAEAQGGAALALLVHTWEEALGTGTAAAHAHSHEVQQAVCSVQCAVATALLPFALGLGPDDGALRPHFTRAAHQLLCHLASTDDDVSRRRAVAWVAMRCEPGPVLSRLPPSHSLAPVLRHVHVQVALTALAFWQDVYVSTLQGLPAPSRHATLGSHTDLLQHLAAGLVMRGQLAGDSLAAATADARDLPEPVRMVRRARCTLALSHASSPLSHSARHGLPS